MDVVSVVDYCGKRAGRGFYAAYSYDDNDPIADTKQKFRKSGLKSEYRTRFDILVDGIRESREALPEKITKTQRSALHLYDDFCVVHLIIDEERGIILFFDKDLASKHRDFVESCLKRA